MELITPKRVVGVHHDPTKFFTIRVVHTEDMQEFLCPDGEDVYHSQQERRRERFREQELAFENRLAADSEEQLRYNNVVNSILDYKDHDEYKRKTSFKYKVLRFLKLTK
jgi:hypothetical protein